MSVILDALRRSRTGATSPGSARAPLPHVPAGLGLGGASSTTASRSSSGRPRLLGIGLLLVIGLGAWAAIQVSQSLMTNYAASVQPSSSSRSARGTPSAPKPATPNQTPSQTPDQTPQPSPSSPTVVLRSAPGREERVQANGGPKQFELAVRYHNLGDYDAALKQYRAVLAADRFNVEAHNNLGLLYHRRGLTREAIEEFRRAIAINGDYVKARSNLAVVLMEAGRLAEARAELRAALTIEPRSADVIVNLALVENADRHRDEAIELLLRAIGYRPTHAMAHYNAAVLYEEQSELVLAYDHYIEFLKFGGPEQGELLSAVQRHLLILKPKLASER